MRERELVRIERVKEAQKRLEEIEQRMHDEIGITRQDGELTVSVPLLVCKKRDLEVFIKRNQKWAVKPPRKKDPTFKSVKSATDSPLMTNQKPLLAQNEYQLTARSHMATKKPPRKSKKPSVDLSKPVGNFIDPEMDLAKISDNCHL